MRFSLANSRFPWRSVRRCSLLLCALFLIPLVVCAQDKPSGFIPGTINIFAGNNTYAGSYTDASDPTTVSVTSPTAVASDSQGNIFFAAGSGDTSVANVYVVYGGATPVPKILSAVTTDAGKAAPVKGKIYQVMFEGSFSYTAGLTASTEQALTAISSLWFDSYDNLYIADGILGSSPGIAAYSVYEVSHDTAAFTLLAGQYQTTSTASINDTVASAAALGNPTDAKTDTYGNIYIADASNAVAYVIYSATKPDGTANTQPPPVLLAEGYSASALTPGNIYTIAGQAQEQCDNSSILCTDTGAAKNSVIGQPISIFVDAAGNVYLLDYTSDVVRVIYSVEGSTVPPLLSAVNSAPTPGKIYVVAGKEFSPCTAASCGDGQLAADAQFKVPNYILADDSGDIYIADSLDRAVRKIDAAGYVSTIVGTANPAQSSFPTPSSGGTATSTPLYLPTSITFDPKQNNLYVADGFYDGNGGYQVIWDVEAEPKTAQTIIFPTLTTPVTYGVNPIPLDATASSGLDVTYSVSSTSPATVSGSGTSAELNVTGAGTIDVTAAQPGNSVYAAATAASGSSLTQHITVNQAPLTVTATSLNMIYGASVPALTANYSGWVSTADENSSTVVTGAPSLSTSATSASNAGTYLITITQGNLASTDYSFTFVNGTMTVTGTTAQSITFPALSAVSYGQTPITLGASASSNLAVTYTVVSGPGTISGSTLTITGAGTIVITASQNGNDTYAGATPMTQSLIVNPAPLTVTAPTLSYTYGTVINTANFSAPTITGWVGTDTSSLVTGGASYTTSASGKADVGSYTINVAQGGLTLASSINANYTFANFKTGSLTITQASQTISKPSLGTVTYGGYPTLTVTSSSNQPVTVTFTGPLAFYGGSTGVTNPGAGNNSIEFSTTGAGAATITLTQAGTTDYAAATPVVLSFNVGQAPLDITAISMTREQGASNPTFTYTVGTSAAGTVGGFVNSDTDIPSVVSGVPTLTTTATQASSPGTYTIAVDTSTMTSANYYFVPVNGTLTVTQAGTYAITASPSSLTIQRGLSAQSIITITPSNGYQGTITLTCGTLPANVTCTVSPSTYTFTGYTTVTGSSGTSTYENAATGTVLINTTAGTVVGSLPAGKSSLRTASFLIPGALAGLFLAFARKRIAKRSAIWSLCALLMLGAGSLAITSCGGSSVNSTAATGTQTITLTGTGTTPSGGTVTAAVPLTVTIQ
jgi:hypothetical protein